jgi:meiotically up-regulated gene 157 (Mug157) protein
MLRREFIRVSGAVSAAAGAAWKLDGADGTQNRVPLPAPGRPPAAQRLFRSARIDALAEEVSGRIGDPELAKLFGECLPRTLDTATTFQTLADGTPDTFLVAGHLPAMWVRDAVCQVWPYVPYIRDEVGLERMVEGVIRRLAQNILFDPYANTFMRDRDALRERYVARPPLGRGIWNRRYQLDNFGYFMRLSHGFWQAGGATGCFDADWVRAAGALVAIMRELQAGSDELPQPRFRFEHLSYAPYDSLPMAGFGPPCRRCGLTRTAFRPSDDAALFPFHIPDNAFAVTGLRQLARMLRTLGLAESLRRESEALAGEIENALGRQRVEHATFGPILPFEVDGYGAVLLMDDAAYPNLIGLPYLGYCTQSDPLYRATRKFALSAHNPYWVSGSSLRGLGGPHCATVYAKGGGSKSGLGVCWPIGIMMEALTTEDRAEIESCLAQLVHIGSRLGFMPEAVWKDDVSYFRGEWFCWANSLFGELILELDRTRPEILREFRSRA